LYPCELRVGNFSALKNSNCTEPVCIFSCFIFAQSYEEDASEDTGLDSIEIIVVHDKKSPKLQGILKQRSVSESSDSTDRQISSTFSGTASDEESEDNPDGGNPDGKNSMGTGCPERQLSGSAGSSNSLKKCVSFNDRVDRTLYATNQSVSAMHAALRSKRRRTRKHDAKQEQRVEKRDVSLFLFFLRQFIWIILISFS